MKYRYSRKQLLKFIKNGEYDLFGTRKLIHDLLATKDKPKSKIKKVMKIMESGYDPDFKTYDYKRVAEEVINLVKK